MTTHTTNHLYISRIDRAILWWRHADKPLICGLLALALVILLASARSWLLGTPAAPKAIPTPALAIIIATPPPAPPTSVPVQQVAAVLPNTLRGAVVAYDAPDGTVLGAIEQGRTYQLLARFGAEWLQADVQGSGVVWLRTDQVLDLPAGLADLEPPPAPVVIERAIYVSAPVLAAPTPDSSEYMLASSAPELQTLTYSADEEPLSPALLREAQDR